jgi:hypothetical protein
MDKQIPYRIKAENALPGRIGGLRALRTVPGRGPGLREARSQKNCQKEEADRDLTNA